MRYHAVIFDLDGVICFTDEYHYTAWKELADGLGIPFDKEKNNRLRGVSRMASLDILLENSPKSYSPEEKQALAEQKNKRYRELLGQMSPADLPEKTKAVLDALRGMGLKLAIGSSSKNAPVILRQIGLEGYFDAVADGSQITHSKPDPEVFFKAAGMLDISPANCLVVEDAVSGAEAAKAGGMHCACVGDAAKNRAGDYNLKSLDDLLVILSGGV